MTKNAARMLRLMDRAVAMWNFPVVGREKGRLIRRLLARHRPMSAIEIGSLIGYSAILIAGNLPPRGRLVCVEANDYLASVVRLNVEAAGLGKRVTVVSGDAVRVVPFLRSRFDFAFIDAAKEEYLDYLRAIEPKLRPGAVVVADNTGAAFKRDVKHYLAYVRGGGRYESREYAFGSDAMEVSILK
jgi:predicted O-methyltransferase YrrM